MRILLSTLFYPPHLNGQSIFIKNLAEGMADLGHEVVVLAPGETGSPRSERCGGVQLEQAPALKLGWIHPDLRMPIFPGRFIKRVFDQFHSQLVHVHDPSLFSQAVIREAHRRRIPVMITHHSGPAVSAPYLKPENPLMKKMIEWLAWKLVAAHLNQADLVTVPSRYSADMLVGRGVHVDMRIIPPGVYLDLFRVMPDLDRKAIRQRYGLDPNRALFLYVGRIDIEKNLNMLIKAMALIERNDIQLAIAGHGSQETSLRHLANHLSLNGRVKFLGQVHHASLPDLLNSADVFVMPGNAESFNIATLEAMACAKPVLAANAAALPDLVSEGVNGYLFQPDQPQASARGIERLAGCREGWPRMGQFSLERAKRYSQPNTLQIHEHVYKACLKTFGAAGSSNIKDRIRTKHQKNRVLRHGFALHHVRAGMLLLLIMFTVFFYDQAQAISDLRLADLTPLHLEPAQKMLVIAPHPDDELLAAGGLIQKVLETGGQVGVVLVTNGDGQYFSPLVVDQKVRPKEIDYIDIGRRRQVESVDALEALGVHRDAIDFLGYPDGKLNDLWVSDWQEAAPVVAPYTRASKSLYENTYNYQSSYLGMNLYNDLVAVLDKVQPDIVLVPHPEDTHTDHSAVSSFSRFAIASYLSSGDYKPPLVLTYLVHYEAYPIPRGTNIGKVLLPPAPLSNRGEGWMNYVLSSDERKIKLDALRTYSSQQKMIGSYMRSFARANEIFYELPVIEMPLFGYEDSEVLEEDLSRLPEPKRERFDRLVLPSGDLVGWKAARLGDILCFSTETRAPITQKITYQIRVKLPGGENLRISQRDESMMFISSDQFGACFNLDDLGMPSAIGFSAETRYGILLDRTAWHFIRLSDNR